MNKSILLVQYNGILSEDDADMIGYHIKKGIDSGCVIYDKQLTISVAQFNDDQAEVVYRNIHHPAHMPQPADDSEHGVE